ncbi:DUF2786 domain-containing protein [Actinacidiphila epipremni]|nr:DUF2786 domain-containing protein [Actinacidiphila epipremni]
MDEAFAAAYGRALGSGGAPDEVDGAASALAAGADWGAVAAGCAGEVVAGCVRRGWEGADLVRMAGRELGPRHQRLAAALEAGAGGTSGAGAGGEAGAGSGKGADAGSGGASGAGAGDRSGKGPGAGGGGKSGAGSGSTSGGKARQEPGRDVLGDFARGERLDRFSAATVFVELMCLYGRLPRIPALDVPPASGGVGGTGAVAPKMLARVRALLAKAESTGFPEEAEALSAKAQHLMARHSIDAALLAARGGVPGDGPGARRIGVDRPYEGAKALLLDAVAAANRCQAVWSAEHGFCTVVGHAPDLDAVELLYTSLLVQADRALHTGRTNRSRDFRESFLIAYASRIRERLTAATAAEESADPAPDLLLPALASRALAVEDTTRRLFPATTTSRLRARDAEGWQHGESAADRATLHERTNRRR